MKKKITLALLLVLMLACVFALTVGATEADPNAEYYDKVYTDLNGKEFPIYEKVGDTYYPLVWFAYEEGEGDAAVTKYVKVHFEDCKTLSYEYGQGRFNGVEYTYVDESGNTIELNTSHAIVLNLRDGVLKSYTDGVWNGKTTPIKTIETTRYHSFSKLQAIYFPLTQTMVGGLASKSALRVCDFDRNHPIGVHFSHACLQWTSIEEIYIPAGSNFGNKSGGTNSQFKGCSKLKKVEFGGAFNDWLTGYLFDGCSALEKIIIPAEAVISPTSGGVTLNNNAFAGCSSLKRVYFMGSKAAIEAIVAGANGGNSNFTGMTQISYDGYCALEDKSGGKYIIYDCSPCLAYNGDVHTASDDKVIIGDDYFAPMQIACPCSVEGCTATMNVGTIPALFTWKGYSVSTFADKNGNYSVAQWFGIDIEAVKEYSLYYTDFELGVAAAIGIDHPVSVVDGAVVYDENAVCAPISTNVDGAIEIKYSYFEIKVTGIPGADSEIGDQRDTAIAFNGYVVAGGAVKYIHFGATYDKAQSASYNSLINE